MCNTIRIRDELFRTEHETELCTVADVARFLGIEPETIVPPDERHEHWLVTCLCGVDTEALFAEHGYAYSRNADEDPFSDIVTPPATYHEMKGTT